MPLKISNLFLKTSLKRNTSEELTWVLWPAPAPASWRWDLVLWLLSQQSSSRLLSSQSNVNVAVVFANWFLIRPVGTPSWRLNIFNQASRDPPFVTYRFLSGQWGPLVRDITFFNQGSRGPIISDVTFLNQQGSVGAPRSSWAPEVRSKLLGNLKMFPPDDPIWYHKTLHNGLRDYATFNHKSPSTLVPTSKTGHFGTSIVWESFTTKSFLT